MIAPSRENVSPRKRVASRRLAVALALVPALGFAATVLAGDPPKRPSRRTVELTLRVTVPNAPAGQAVEVWVPRPLGEAARDFQTVEEPLSVLQVHATRSEQKPWVFHATTAPNESFSLTWIARVERRAQATPAEVLAVTASELSAEEKKTLAADLEPEKANPFDEAFLERARKIAPAEKAIPKVARAIYNHVIESMRYEKPAGKGWGRGSIDWACREGYGNCTDFHALFMNLCRARGIPARFCLGVSLPRERRGTVAGYHCWAEFYVPGGHWVPVDASEAWKNPEKREDYFGGLDADRVLLVRGRDLVLAPPQKGPPLSILKLGYAETAEGKEVPVETELTYEDVR